MIDEKSLPRLSILMLWTPAGPRDTNMENYLSEILGQKNFTIIESSDPVIAGEVNLFNNFFSILPGSNNLDEINNVWLQYIDADRIMSFFPADIALIGQIHKRTKIDSVSTSKSIRCHVSLKFIAIDLKSGKITLKQNLSTTGGDVVSRDKACQNALSGIGKIVIQSFLQSAYSDLSKPEREVTILIESLPDFNSLQKIKDVLEKLKEVSKVEYEEFRTGGTATLKVTSNGGALYLMSQLRSYGIPDLKAGMKKIGENELLIVILPEKENGSREDTKTLNP